jgi:adenylate kinase family enzyme
VRVSVVGTSGSGKSTVGRAAATRLGVPFVELDAIFHQRGWVELPEPEFQRRVAELADGDGWVIDGNYSAVRPILRERATLIVWLDLPRWVTMAQVTWRSTTRAALHRELWNGNRESWRNVLSRDPTKSMIRWTWTTYTRRRREYAEQMDERWVRLQSRRQVRRWLDSLDSVRS